MKPLEVRYGKIFGVLIVCLIALQSCKKPKSRLKDIATRDKLKTGLFAPQASIDLAPKSVSQKMTPQDFSTQSGISLQKENPLDKFTVVVDYDGEQVLLLEKVGMFPQPVASRDKAGKFYVWSLQIFGNVETGAQGTIYVKTATGQKVSIEVSSDGNRSNLYFMRHPTNSSGRDSPAIVNMLNHIQTASGAMLYKVGNLMFEARTNAPVMEYIRISEKVWRVRGVYASKDVENGTVFWTTDYKTYSSIVPGGKEIVNWRVQDDNSMDVNNRVARGNLPKIVADAESVAAKEKLSGIKAVPTLGYNELLPGPRVIPVYQTSAAYPTKAKSIAKGFSLAGDIDDPDFVDPNLKYAVPAPAQKGLSLNDSVEASRVGSILQLRNQNNGGYYRVRALKSDPISIRKGNVNALYSNLVGSGNSEYVGRDETYEILDKDGKGTGQYIRQQWYPSMGVNSEYSTQRHVSLDELDVEMQRSQEGRDEKLRALHEKNAELQQNTETALKAGADSQKAFTQSILSAPTDIAVATIKDNLPGVPGGLAGKVAVDVAAEGTKQVAAAATTAIANAALGGTGVNAVDQINATKIVTSGAASILKNVALKPAGQNAGKIIDSLIDRNSTEASIVVGSLAGTGAVKLADGLGVKPLVTGKTDVRGAIVDTAIDQFADLAKVTTAVPGGSLVVNTLATEVKILNKGVNALGQNIDAANAANAQGAVLSEIANQTVGQSPGEVNELLAKLAARRNEIRDSNPPAEPPQAQTPSAPSSDPAPAPEPEPAQEPKTD